jgi:hypothetical protein
MRMKRMRQTRRNEPDDVLKKIELRLEWRSFVLLLPAFLVGAATSKKSI